MSSIANKIDSILKDRKMSRRRLAIISKIPTSTLQSAMERDRNYPIEMLQKICAALQVPYDEVIPDTMIKECTEPDLVTLEKYFPVTRTQHTRHNSSGDDKDLLQIIDALTPDNKAKIFELANLFLNAQKETEKEAKQNGDNSKEGQ